MRENFVRNYKFMFQTIHRASKGRIAATIIFTAVSHLFSIFYSVLFLAYFMNAVSSKAGMREVFGRLLIFVVLNIVFEIVNSIYTHVYLPRDDIRLSLYLKEMIYNKILSVDMECFDDNEYYDNITFAMKDLFQRVKSILNNISQFVTHMLCVTVLIGYFSQVDTAIVLITTISVLTGLIFEPLVNRNIYRYQSESIKYDRRFEYLKRIAVQQDYAQELRTTNVSRLISHSISDAFGNLQQMIKKYYRKVTFIHCIEEFVGYGFVSLLVTLMAVYKIIVVRSADIAMFLPLLGAVAEFTWRASSVISTYNSILNDNIYLNKFCEFFLYEPKIVSAEGEAVDSAFAGIDIQHVWFRYKDTANYMLKDINMRIQPGQKVAIVGYNGAGKTTLIQLILRFYDPVKGNILYNGKRITGYHVREYRKQYGVVFQDINIYAASVANNISMDAECYPAEAMDQVIESMGIKDKINQFAGGYETPLTHELDEEGEMLSVGQSQCLVLTRIFMNPDTQIYILDEPTSALDPIAEEEIFQTINEYLKDMTVIYISHRFSASKIADRIYFMEQGRIKEEGTHEELMGLKGAYAEMFQMQAKYYQEEA